jgi:hypothetical protein
MYELSTIEGISLLLIIGVILGIREVVRIG